MGANYSPREQFACYLKSYCPPALFLTDILVGQIINRATANRSKIDWVVARFAKEDLLEVSSAIMTKSLFMSDHYAGKVCGRRVGD